MKLQRTRHRSPAASRHTFQFVGGGHRAVFPIIVRSPNHIIELVGTGCFVAADGVIATARHIFEVRQEPDGGRFEIVQEGEGHLVFRHIAEVVKHGTADVAVGLLGAPHDNCESCRNHPVVGIMRLDPKPNELLGSFAFSHILIGEPETLPLDDGPDLAQRMQYRSHWELGLSETVYPDGLGHVKGRCFGTSVLVEGRASGAPLFNSNGFVIGLNSRSFSQDEGLPHSTASSITSIEDLVIDGRSVCDRRRAEGGHETYRPIAARQALATEDPSLI